MGFELPTDKKPKRSLSELWNTLREHYQADNAISLLCYADTPFAIEDVYVQLQLISDKERSLEQNSLSKLQSGDDNYLDAYENIYTAKQPIRLEGLYQTLQTKAGTQYLLNGRAGIGKSVFLKHVLYRWSLEATHSRALWNEQFDWVFLIPLRNLERYIPSEVAKSNKEILLDVLEAECFGSGLHSELHQEERELLLRVIVEPNHHAVLWLLDGYDELNAKKSPQLQAFFDYLLKAPYCVMTSRPYHYTGINKQFTHIELMGFDGNAIEEYIDRFYPHIGAEVSASKIRQLKKLIEANPNLKGMAHVPINLELLCSIWSQEELTFSQFTITALYRKIVENLTNRYYEKIPGTESADSEKIFDFLNTLAFVGMKKHRILLADSEIDSAMTEVGIRKIRKKHLLEEIKKTGFLKAFGNGTSYSFLHLSFQEYFAASYLADKMKKEPTKWCSFIREYKYEPRYQVMWWFLAGELSYCVESYDEALNLYFTTLCEEPFTIPGLYQICLLARCLNETQFSIQVLQKSVILANFAESLKCSLKGSATRFFGSGGWAPGGYRNDGAWQSMLMDVIYACRGIVSTQEVENILIESHSKGESVGLGFFRKAQEEINWDIFRGKNLLSPRCLALAIRGDFGMSSCLWGFSESDTNLLLSSMKKHSINCTSEVLLAIEKSVGFYKYDYISEFSAQLLCHYLPENMGIIAFLFEISAYSEECFEFNFRYSSPQNTASVLLDYIKQYALEYSKNSEILFCFCLHKLAINPKIANPATIHSLEVELIEKGQPNHELMEKSLKENEADEMMLDALIDVVHLGKSDLRTSEVSTQLLHIFNTTTQFYLKAKCAALLVNWEFFISAILEKLAYQLKLIDKGEPQLKLGIKILVDIVEKCISLYIKERSLKEIMISILCNHASELKGSFEGLLDYLFFSLTPREERISLLKELLTSGSSKDRQVGIDNIQQALEQWEESRGLYGLPQIAKASSNKSKKAEVKSAAGNFKDIVNLYIAHPDYYCFSSVRKLINDCEIAVYLGSDTLFYRIDKKVDTISLPLRSRERLIKDWIGFEEFPLFKEMLEGGSEGAGVAERSDEKQVPAGISSEKLKKASQVKKLLKKIPQIYKKNNNKKQNVNASPEMTEAPNCGVNYQRGLVRHAVAVILSSYPYQEEHRDLALALCELENIYNGRWGVKKKANLLKTTLPIFEQHFGKSHIIVCVLLYQQGIIMMGLPAIDDVFEALRCFDSISKRCEQEKQANPLSEELFSKTQECQAKALNLLRAEFPKSVRGALLMNELKKLMEFKKKEADENNYLNLKYSYLCKIGKFYLLYQHPTAAATTFYKAFELAMQATDNQQEVPYHNIACMLHVTKHIQEADACFKKGIEHRFTPAILAEYAHFLYQQERYDDCLSYCEQCLSMDSLEFAGELNYDAMEKETVAPAIKQLVEKHGSISLEARGLAYYLQACCYIRSQNKEGLSSALFNFEHWKGSQYEVGTYDFLIAELHQMERAGEVFSSRAKFH